MSFIPSELDAAIKKVEEDIPDTPGGRLMRAAYRPFMIQISKELDDDNLDPSICHDLFVGVSKLCSNLMVTVVRSLNDPDNPNAGPDLMAVLLTMLDHDIVVDFRKSYGPDINYVKSETGMMQ